MDYVFLIAWGVAVGLIAAVPIGPVNILCIRRTLQFGTLYGFVSGLGAALGDGLFASVMAFGFTAIQQLITGYSPALQLIGGLLLLTIGIRTFQAPPPTRFSEALAPTANGTGKGNTAPARAMTSTFTLVITNPATLFGFTAWFSSLSGLLGNKPSFIEAAFAVAGVLAGSTLWWLILTTTVGLLHARIDDRFVRRINEISGAVMVVFGIGVLGHLAWVHLLHGSFNL